MVLVITKYELLDKRASATWLAAESTRSTLFSLAAVTFCATRHMHEHSSRHLRAAVLGANSLVFHDSNQQHGQNWLGVSKEGVIARLADTHRL